MTSCNSLPSYTDLQTPANPQTLVKQESFSGCFSFLISLACTRLPSATFMQPIARSQIEWSIKLVTYIQSVLNQSVLFVKKAEYSYLTHRIVKANSCKFICLPNPTILSSASYKHWPNILKHLFDYSYVENASVFASLYIRALFIWRA